MKIGLTPMLDSFSTTPVYTQLYQYIRHQIEIGVLQTNTRMPSIRQLSAHLHVSKNTVDAAYQQLLAEGYIRSRERSGYTVQPLDEWTAMPSVPPALSSVQPEVTETDTLKTFDFRYGDVDLLSFPLDAWRKCMNAALTQADQDLLGYGDRKGLLDLRKEIAMLVYQSRGIMADPDQIIISAGTQHAVSLLCQWLDFQGKAIAIEDPGYHGVRTVFSNLGCTMHPIGLEADGISIDQLKETSSKIIYVTPSHQFPMGMVLPIQKRLRLLQWAKEHNGYIIEDDYDSEFRYKGSPIPALKGLDREERVIYLGTLSKSFLPSVRLSYIILPTTLMKTVDEKLQSYSQSVSPIIQQAVLRFMKQGSFARHIRRMKRIYQQKHRTLTAALTEHMRDHASIIGDHSGLHLLLDVKGRSSDELVLLAEKAGCIVYSPRKHWLHAHRCPDSYVMIGFGGLSEEELLAGVKQLAKAWFHN